MSKEFVALPQGKLLGEVSDQTKKEMHLLQFVPITHTSNYYHKHKTNALEEIYTLT